MCGRFADLQALCESSGLDQAVIRAGPVHLPGPPAPPAQPTLLPPCPLQTPGLNPRRLEGLEDAQDAFLAWLPGEGEGVGRVSRQPPRDRLRPGSTSVGRLLFKPFGRKEYCFRRSISACWACALSVLSCSGSQKWFDESRLHLFAPLMPSRSRQSGNQRLHTNCSLYRVGFIRLLGDMFCVF